MTRIGSFEKLVKLVERLRSKDGCPWDKEQTIESMAEDVVDEAKEVAEAVEHKDYENLREELGDLMWAIVLLAQIAKDEGKFDIEASLKEVNEKIVRRHPHVFGGVNAASTEEATRMFYRAKAAEKKAKQ